MRKSFKYRLFTNKHQEDKLLKLLNAGRYLYNNALEHRIICYKDYRKSVSYYEQAKALKEIRAFDKDIAELNCWCCQNILRNLDKAFQAFFRRLKSGEKPGFPRFKSADRFHSLTFTIGDGVKLKNNKLYIQNVGYIRINLHRDIFGKIKTVTIKHENYYFYAIFSCEDIPMVNPPKTYKEIGIDVGIKSFATLSNGEIIENPKYLKKAEDKLKSVQSKYSKKKSKKVKRQLIALHTKIANQRKDFQHKLSRKIINEYDYIYIEKLKPKDMNSRYKVLNKFINDAAWSQFFNMLVYKAEEAGRQVIKIEPKNTTQACSNCGKIIPKDLSIRIHSCSCGLTIDRDINAAINILRLGHSLCFEQEAV